MDSGDADHYFHAGHPALLYIKRNIMKLKWFNRRAMFFVPVSWTGWSILAIAVIYAVYIFRVIDSTSHSVSDTLINFVLYLLIIGAVYSLIGFFTSGEKK